MQAGHDVIFLNGAFISHDEIISSLKNFSPDVVGLYSTAFGWPKAKATATSIKENLDKVFIFAGGPYPIATGADCLRQEDSGGIDAVIIGEAERVLVSLLKRLACGCLFRDIPGVAYRGRAGDILDNGSAPLIDNLDELPFPARELLGDPNKYIPPPATYRRKPVAVVITSRGCNRRCLYCFQVDRERTKGIRMRSVPNVIKELELLKEQGYREIKFIDDTLAADYDRALEIAREMKSKNLGFTWFASACVNQVDEPLLRAFKEAGCWAILFGAESGVQKNLNAIRKGITLEQIKKAVQAAKNVGLHVQTPFMFGIPGETYDEALETIDFAIELDPDIANFHSITPFPGTDLYDNIEDYGTLEGGLSEFTYQGAAFVPYTMTREQIQELRQLAFKRFYSRPSYLFKRLLKLRTMKDVKASIEGVKSLLGIISGGEIKGKAS
jgi:radical SAM superfamily enzyme YgiQ (UPF0313 family)